MLDQGVKGSQKSYWQEGTEYPKFQIWQNPLSLLPHTKNPYFLLITFFLFSFLKNHFSLFINTKKPTLLRWLEFASERAQAKEVRGRTQDIEVGNFSIVLLFFRF